MTGLAMTLLVALGPGPAADTLEAEVVLRIGGSAGDVLLERLEALELDATGRDRGRGPPVTAEERSAALEGLDRFQQMGGHVDPSRIPDRKPILSTFVLDDRDRIWALLSPASGDPGTTVMVYDSENEFRTVRIGTRIAPHPTPVVREGWMVAVAVDGLGLQTVLLIRLPPALSGPRSGTDPSAGT